MYLSNVNLLLAPFYVPYHCQYWRMTLLSWSLFRVYSHSRRTPDLLFIHDISLSNPNSWLNKVCRTPTTHVSISDNKFLLLIVSQSARLTFIRICFLQNSF